MSTISRQPYLDVTEDEYYDESGSENEINDPMSEEEQPDEPNESDEPDEPDEPVPRSITRHASAELVEYLNGKPFIALNHIHRYLHETYPNRISRKASAALIGVIQRLMVDLIMGVETEVRKGKSMRISAKKIGMAIHRDEEFTKLLSHVSIPESGVYGIIGGVAVIPTYQLNRRAI